MLKNILWAVVLSSAVLVMSVRDEEQEKEWKQYIDLCINSGQQCPKHLREE